MKTRINTKCIMLKTLFIPKTPKENCLGNLVIEHYFGILKSELYFTMKLKGTNHLKYNNEIIKLNKKKRSSIQYRAPLFFIDYSIFKKLEYIL